MKENRIKRLVASIKCSSCGQNYEISDIDVLGHSEDLWFLRVLCTACKNQCLVAAIIGAEKVPVAVTDLTEAEINKFAGADVVGADDVLRMHSFLKEFDGDFACLFGQEQS